jgi:non-ribosomal peptide synthetase component F
MQTRLNTHENNSTLNNINVDNKTYWLEKLDGINPPLFRHIDKYQTTEPIYANVNFTIPSHLLHSLQNTFLNVNINLEYVLLASVFTLLFRYTGQTDLCINSLITDQSTNYMSYISSHNYMNIPMRLNMHSESTLTDIVNQLITLQQEALLQQEKLNYLYQSEEVEILAIQKKINNIIFHFNCSDKTTMPSPYYLGFTFNTDNNGINANIVYNKNYFQESFIQRMTGHILQCLQAAVENTYQPITELSLLTDTEKQFLLNCNATGKAPILEGLFVHELFSSNAKNHPNTIALVYHAQDNSTETLTYGELDTITDSIAELLNTMGVGPGKPVGLSITRSINLVIGILATFKAGGIIVPLETEVNDRNRKQLEYKINDTKLHYFLTDNTTESLFSIYQQQSNANIFNIATLRSMKKVRNLINQLASNLNSKANLSESDLAYIIYTSGTTGQPKGVMIPHKGLTNLANALADRNLKPASKVLVTAPPTFDAFFLEMFEALLLTQGEMHLIYEEGRLSPSVLNRIISNYQINVATMLPKVIENLDPQRLPSLQDVTTMGAIPDEKVINKLLDCPNVHIRNEYGPTETTIDATEHICKKGEAYTSIGRPIRNLQMFILDDYGNECPIGVVGKIYIAGIALARGYVNNKELTHQKFQIRIFDPSKRSFKQIESKKEPITSPILTIDSTLKIGNAFQKRNKHSKSILTNRNYVTNNNAISPLLLVETLKRSLSQPESTTNSQSSTISNSSINNKNKRTISKEKFDQKRHKKDTLTSESPEITNSQSSQTMDTSNSQQSDNSNYDNLSNALTTTITFSSDQFNNISNSSSNNSSNSSSNTNSAFNTSYNSNNNSRKNSASNTPDETINFRPLLQNTQVTNSPPLASAKSKEIRLYDTGDLAYRAEDGSIVFCCRADNQIKLGGAIRFELAGIETILKKEKNLIKDIVVKPTSDNNGFDIFIIPMPNVFINKAVVDSILANSPLPAVARPQQVIVVNREAFALNKNGKIDLAQLHAPTLSLNKLNLTIQTTDLYSQIANAWANILHLSADSLSKEISFKNAGGTSLQLASLESAVNNMAYLNYSKHTNIALTNSNITLEQLVNIVNSALKSESTYAMDNTNSANDSSPVLGEPRYIFNFSPFSLSQKNNHLSFFNTKQNPTNNTQINNLNSAYTSQKMSPSTNTSNRD